MTKVVQPSAVKMTSPNALAQHAISTGKVVKQQVTTTLQTDDKEQSQDKTPRKWWIRKDDLHRTFLDEVYGEPPQPPQLSELYGAGGYLICPIDEKGEEDKSKERKITVGGQMRNQIPSLIPTPAPQVQSMTQNIPPPPPPPPAGQSDFMQIMMANKAIEEERRSREVEEKRRDEERRKMDREEEIKRELAKEVARKEEERLKDEKRKEEERLKEEKRKEEEKLRDEKRKEEERLREAKKEEEEAKHRRELELKKIELEGKRIEEDRKRDEERRLEEKRREEREESARRAREEKEEQWRKEMQIRREEREAEDRRREEQWRREREAREESERKERMRLEELRIAREDVERKETRRAEELRLQMIEQERKDRIEREDRRLEEQRRHADEQRRYMDLQASGKTETLKIITGAATTLLPILMEKFKSEPPPPPFIPPPPVDNTPYILEAIRSIKEDSRPQRRYEEEDLEGYLEASDSKQSSLEEAMSILKLGIDLGKGNEEKKEEGGLLEKMIANAPMIASALGALKLGQQAPQAAPRPPQAPPRPQVQPQAAPRQQQQQQMPTPPSQMEGRHYTEQEVEQIFNGTIDAVFSDAEAMRAQILSNPSKYGPAVLKLVNEHGMELMSIMNNTPSGDDTQQEETEQ
jgi:hypothetical protein